MRHTPGPWHVGPHQKILTCGWSIRIAEDDSAIAYVLGEKNPELRQNASLIAAAPELLESLQGLCDLIEAGCSIESIQNGETLRVARAVITEATV